MFAASAERIEALFLAAVAAYAFLLGAFEAAFRRALESSSPKATWPWLTLLAALAGYHSWWTWSGGDNPFQLRALLVCAIVLPMLVVATVRDVIAVIEWRRSR